MIDPAKIINSKLVTDHYGEWPSFHDAEVISVQLDRIRPTLTTSIYVFRMTSQVDERGYYVVDRKAVVTLAFHDVCQLSLQEWNNQNVLFELALNDVSASQLEGVRFEVIFDSSYGLSASFRCKEIEVVSLEPFRANGQPAEQRTAGQTR